MIAMVLVWWPIYARLLRGPGAGGQATRARRGGGVGRRVALADPAPPRAAAVVTPVLVNATMDFGQVVLLTASLSFLGLGATPPSPEWGVMITEGRANFYQWWIALGPGVAIFTVVMAFNFLGDGLRDHFDVRDAG